MWDCKYHVVFIPKYRKKALYGELRRRMGEMFRTLAAQKECKVLEGHLMPDHVHMLISIPPKYSVAHVIGYIKGKSTIHVAPTFFDQKRNFVGQHSELWPMSGLLGYSFSGSHMRTFQI